MKTILIAVIALASVTSLNSQPMERNEQPKDVVLQLFIATDEQDWQAVEQSFTDRVLLDYSSMGNPAATLEPTQIVKAWQTILPGFGYTHHQIGNLQQTIENNIAQVAAYGTATHYLEHPSGNVWTVVGTYDFELELKNNQWKIKSMQFHFKYQDGNTLLPQLAMDHVAGKSTDTGSKSDHKASVAAFLEALELKDMEALLSLFAEDGRHVNPYHSNLFPKGAEGHEEIRSYWKPVFTNFGAMEFPIESILSTEDPTLVYAKFKGRIELKNNGGYYENNYYATFKFNEKGEIIEYVEIFNPITAAKSFGLLDKLK
ncbi:MAG: nuclear transport factor 2 family protein [Bacteroidota bacterium]